MRRLPLEREAAKTVQWRARWLAAMRWRRRVEKALAQSGLTFTQWQVLDATAVLVVETGDAVSQNQVSERTQLDRNTVSQVMRTLEQKRLVSRGPCCIGTSWRVFQTERAVSVLNALRGAVEAASE